MMRFPLILIALATAAAQVPTTDSRNTHIRHTHTHYSMPDYTRAEWESRAEFLKKQILFSSGLLPLPEKTALTPRISGKIEHEDYTVENVLLETYPGYYLGGNLYRPVGKQGSFPAVVSPHGHWRYGRFENSELNSLPSRAINLARQGYVVFNYDMVGWNDTVQLPHDFMGPREELWLIGPLGTQLWNSIRVVDFLEALPSVDAGKIAVTGASGGATQAFLLAAVDERIRYAAPVNMVSFIMQGGSPCENAPLLRIDTNNVEFAAMFAPKPMMMIAATGDWTKNVPRDEFPAVQSIYRLLDAASNVETQQFDSPHNYHQDSREAVYRFFGKHILADDDASPFKERRVTVDGVSSLLSLFGREWPDNAVDQSSFIRDRIDGAEADTAALFPSDRRALDRAKEAFRERLGMSVRARTPAEEDLVSEQLDDGRIVIGRKSVGDRVAGRIWNREAAGAPTLVVGPAGHRVSSMSGVGKQLIARGGTVLAIDAFQTGEAAAVRDIAGAGRSAERYFRVFNRGDDANRVQDVLTALAFLKHSTGADEVNVVGTGRAGLWVALAAALSGDSLRVVADIVRFDTADDAAYIERLPVPGLRRAGDFRAAAVLLSGQRVLVHNTAATFPREWYQSAFDAAGNSGGLTFQSEEAGVEQIVEWLTLAER